jgi:hypothetical protein
MSGPRSASTDASSRGYRRAPIAFTLVNIEGAAERYRFDEASYDAIAAAGLDWLSAQDVLFAKPVVRQHIGAVLRIAGEDRRRRWIVVALIEDATDDEYLVVSARLMDAAEIAAVERIFREGTDS